MGLVGVLFCQYQEQGEHLDGFSEAHVVGEASAKAKRRDQMHPTRALFLVRPKLGFERCAWVDVSKLLGVSKRVEGFVEPATRVDLDPFVVDLGGDRRGARNTSEHSHSIEKRDAFTLDPFLDRLPVIERLLKLRGVDLDPFSAQ